MIYVILKAEKKEKKNLCSTPNPVFVITNMPTSKKRKCPPGFEKFQNELRRAPIEGTRPFERNPVKSGPPGFEKKKFLKPPPGFENHRHTAALQIEKKLYQCAICNAEFEEQRDLNEHGSNVHDEKNQVLKQRPIFESQVLKYLEGLGKEARKLEDSYKVGEVLGEGGFGTVYKGVVISEGILKISQVTVTQLFII